MRNPDVVVLGDGQLLARWKLFEDPSLLPPLNGGAILRHLGRSMSYAPVCRWMGPPLSDLVSASGLAGWEPLRIYLDAVSQIAVQASSAEAEAPFAMAATDRLRGLPAEEQGAYVAAIRGEMRETIARRLVPRSC